MAEFSPMMQHYLATKKQYNDCILFYRLGDFYEMFFDDAITVSKELPFPRLLTFLKGGSPIVFQEAEVSHTASCKSRS